jgi:hypothetical protein
LLSAFSYFLIAGLNWRCQNFKQKFAEKYKLQAQFLIVENQYQSAENSYQKMINYDERCFACSAILVVAVDRIRFKSSISCCFCLSCSRASVNYEFVKKFIERYNRPYYRLGCGWVFFVSFYQTRRIKRNKSS